MSMTPINEGGPATVTMMPGAVTADPPMQLQPVQPMQPQPSVGMLPMQPQPMQPQPMQPAQPQQQPGMSIFDLIRAPQQAQFNVQQAQGTKPKNYQPARVGMSNIPMPSVFALLGAGRQGVNPFTVTPASGTRPSNYRPAQISMNAPTLAGPAAMQQMLALMGGGFRRSPFGQVRG